MTQIIPPKSYKYDTRSLVSIFLQAQSNFITEAAKAGQGSASFSMFNAFAAQASAELSAVQSLLARGIFEVELDQPLAMPNYGLTPAVSNLQTVSLARQLAAKADTMQPVRT